MKLQDFSRHLLLGLPMLALGLLASNLVGHALPLANAVETIPSRKTTQDSGSRIKTAEGFVAETVFEVPREFGSWVSLTSEKPGCLIASDQYGKLYRITPAENVQDSKIEPLDIKIGRAQGLLYAFDGLYVMAHAGEGQPAGLYKATDSNGDGQYDQVDLKLKLNGGGEHGPHAILLSPDKQSLYICAGNHTDLPEVDSSRLPKTWQEDQVLPRMWDAGGHAVGKMAPGGWVCKVSPDGDHVELIGAGFRNEYDMAFNSAGELFAYDADMEWDVGAPWYRPTRVNHVVSGAEFGWRSGTGKWPEYYADSLGSVVDIGPGSPTGVTFGYGTHYPAKYQNALYICDWSYGIIYAVHLTADGASYAGETEMFASAPAMQVADIAVLPSDGSLYYVIGGRRTASSLVRVRYTGDESTSPAAPVQLSETAQTRRRLEAGHRRLGGDDARGLVALAMDALSSDDRVLRYAARIALEHQDPSLWMPALDKLQSPRLTLELTMAAIRSGNISPDTVISLLGGLKWEELNQYQKLHLLRDYGLASCRLEDFGKQWPAVIGKLSEQFPSRDKTLNIELARLLIAAGDPAATEKTVSLLKDSFSQEEQIHYALCLSHAKEGWTVPLREAYFTWFVDATNFRGGNSFGGFIRNIREQAIANLPMDDMNEADRKAIETVLAIKPQQKDPASELEDRQHVKKWTTQEVLEYVEQDLKDRDFENGRKMFAVAQCYKCHRMSGIGGMVGPDLTAVGRRFNKHDLVQSLIEPSAVVSDQYQATIFLLDDGRVVQGRVANLHGDNYSIQEDMLQPGTFTNIRASSIEEMKPSENSMMPTGLLDTLTRDDILDLVAYLRSAGDPEFEEFATQAASEE